MTNYNCSQCDWSLHVLLFSWANCCRVQEASNFHSYIIPLITGVWFISCNLSQSIQTKSSWQTSHLIAKIIINTDNIFLFIPYTNFTNVLQHTIQSGKTASSSSNSISCTQFKYNTQVTNIELISHWVCSEPEITFQAGGD